MVKENYKNLYNTSYNTDNDYTNVIYNLVIEEEYHDLTTEDLLRMNNWYAMIKKIPNYSKIESIIYSKFNVTSKLEKIAFELKRIYKYASDNHLTETEISFLNYLLKYYEFILKNSKMKPEKFEEHCNKLLKLIIKMEIKFNIKIGLFEEFVNYYEQYNSYYGKNKKNIVNSKKILDKYFK